MPLNLERIPSNLERMPSNLERMPSIQVLPQLQSHVTTKRIECYQNKC
jgi:hypothetical protein